jgi:hypothetical protein
MADNKKKHIPTFFLSLSLSRYPDILCEHARALEEKTPHQQTREGKFDTHSTSTWDDSIYGFSHLTKFISA